MMLLMQAVSEESILHFRTFISLFKTITIAQVLYKGIESRCKQNQTAILFIWEYQS